jgi:phospholipase C
MGEGEQQCTNGLDTFDHVVVLMLENRSFDSLLGYLYSQKDPAPNGKQFEGVDGHNLSNPIPPPWQFTRTDGTRVTEVPVGRITDVDLVANGPPFPDPGEDYPHVNTQLFKPNNPVPDNRCPYNLPSPVPEPLMNGFVTDYIQNYFSDEYPHGPILSPEGFYDRYKYIMKSYDPADVPVLSGLAREFAVFDHWFCSVPSETICNRNFWHAGTSWGHVINPGPADDPGDEDNQPNTDQWVADTAGETLFSQLSGKNIAWKIYSDNKIPLSDTENLSLPVTPLLHLLNFFPLFLLDDLDMFSTLEGFKCDCASGTLPAYSFIEPNFFNPHNDMHPSTPGELGDGPQIISPVLLGEVLVWEVYNAIFTSKTSKVWDKTLLIITFDEHGGCYDHVRPPGHYGDKKVVEPAEIATPPDLSSGQKNWDCFDFKRLGLRVPTIMVSPYIKKNTIINDCMSHTSFLKTMHAKWEKWKLPSPSKREDASPCFNVPGLFCSTPRTMSEMPVFAAPLVPPDHTDYSKAVMAAVARAIMSLIAELWRREFPIVAAIMSLIAKLWCWAFPKYCPTKEMKIQRDAASFLRRAIRMAKMRHPIKAAKRKMRYRIKTAKRKLGRGEPVKGRINELDWALLFQVVAEKQKKKGRW